MPGFVKVGEMQVVPTLEWECQLTSWWFQATSVLTLVMHSRRGKLDNSSVEAYD